eukprot:CFRG5636T1
MMCTPTTLRSAPAMKSSKPSFEGLELYDTLGEGTYAKVKLGIASNGEKYAVKVVNLRHKNAKTPEEVSNVDSAKQIFQDVKKEICIHKNISHRHVIKFHGFKQIDAKIYILLEYAAGGELFDKIEPDVGVCEDLAHVYFKQLCSGIKYLHISGIAHRDIKPENILLDDYNNFKISDFGLSTVFRHKGQERTLTRRCGTFPYIAPEVFNQEEYHAQPADIWSCGIVLVTLLAGCLPWDEPSSQCADYANWESGTVDMTTQYPWSNMSPCARDLMKGLLTVDPKKRFTMSDIEKHAWFMRVSSLTRQTNDHGLFVPDLMPVDQYMEYLNIKSPPRSKRRPNSDLTEKTVGKKDVNYVDGGFALSQPVEFVNEISSLSAGVEAELFFSQPMRADDMLLSQADMASQFSQTQNRQRTLIRRLTRFMSRASQTVLADRLQVVFESMRYKCEARGTSQLVVTSPSVRRGGLRFVVLFYPMGNNAMLVEFRRNKGDGLEFKRIFKNVKQRVKGLVAADIDSAKTFFSPLIEFGPYRGQSLFDK